MTNCSSRWPGGWRGWSAPTIWSPGSAATSSPSCWSAWHPPARSSAARELLATLDAPIELGGLRVRVEASAGIGIWTRPVAEPRSSDANGEATIVELLRQADVAMYQAKRGGPRIVRYDAGLDTADVAQLMLGGDLPRAVAEREFTVLFQPIVDLATGDHDRGRGVGPMAPPGPGDLDPRRFLAAVERPVCCRRSPRPYWTRRWRRCSVAGRGSAGPGRGERLTAQPA